MIKSMTGFGRCTAETGGMNITVELKSVNNRYFDFSARIPRNYGFLEEKLKGLFMKTVSRGKIECFVTVEALEEPDIIIAVNRPLLRSYLDAYEEIESEFGIKNDIEMSDVVKVPDVLAVRKAAADEEKIWAAVQEVALGALANFVSMRETEGARLREDVLGRLDLILDMVAYIEERSPETVKEYNEKLLARLRDLLADTAIDEQRILTEAAIFADKIAVAEETVRLRSHISQMKKLLDLDEAVGKKMDFVVQEMNREANTIGSKANDIEITARVVDIKAEIEKIREQIQNIE